MSCTILRMRTPGRLAWNMHGSVECGVHVMRQDPQQDLLPHDHLFHEIAFVDRGEAQHATAAGVEALRAGDVIVLRPQVWHGYQRCRNFAVINCLINPKLLQQLIPFLGQVEGALDLFRRHLRASAETAPLLLRPASSQRYRLRRSLEAMLEEQQRRENGWQAVNTSLLLDLLTRTVRLSQARKREGHVALSGQMEAAVLQTAQYVETHLTEPVSLDQLAAHAGVSGPHLSRCFSKRMGMGVIDYLHRLRAEEACRLLRLTDLPITAIAVRLGYSEIAYFSRCFRACIGQSPREYRGAGGGS